MTEHDAHLLIVYSIYNNLRNVTLYLTDNTSNVWNTPTYVLRIKFTHTHLSYVKYLTAFCLMTSYGDKQRCQHWLM